METNTEWICMIWMDVLTRQQRTRHRRGISQEPQGETVRENRRSAAACQTTSGTTCEQGLQYVTKAGDASKLNETTCVNEDQQQNGIYVDIACGEIRSCNILSLYIDIYIYLPVLNARGPCA